MLKPENRERQVMRRSEVIERALVIAAGPLATAPKPNPKGITVANVLEIFPGSRIHLPTAADLTKPDRCKHCGDNPHARIVRRTWQNGNPDWCCHRCGKEVKP